MGSNAKSRTFTGILYRFCIKPVGQIILANTSKTKHPKYFQNPHFKAIVLPLFGMQAIVGQGWYKMSAVMNER